jgi:23S rRNA (pseudouridine1915-N3)-methyltransferase
VHVRLIAVGARQPGWVASAFDSYIRRLPGHWRFRLEAIAPGPRAGDPDGRKAVVDEGLRILKAIRAAERVVLLDERGTEFSSAELGRALAGWQADGRDLAFVIGGPDGVSEACLQRAEVRWSLSRLTLPHGLARVLFAEQMYRAWTLATGHPYHRA